MKEPLTRIELALIRVYRGTICPACGKSKAQRQPVCRSCYSALDAKTKNALHARLDDDAFYDSYLQVIDGLVKKGVGKQISDLPAAARRALDDMGIAEALSHAHAKPAPATLYIVLDNGLPLVFNKTTGSPAVAKRADGFADYELAYKLLTRRRQEYVKLARQSKPTCADAKTCSGRNCDFHRILALANGVKTVRIEAR